MAVLNTEITPWYWVCLAQIPNVQCRRSEMRYSPAHCIVGVFHTLNGLGSLLDLLSGGRFRSVSIQMDLMHMM